ncbi:CPBP family intramembrane glutamic endopeptidase [Leuconostoc carnosum]|uniref:CPBP family intramembrane glutamic endopeptidase n=1 Tax=Leuconostoc carnosum TaxID=1252 RepID=UPI0016130419|nr:CPBP family intramembrane glutamic endopeptidase [Leuconostoc carnosum]MBB6432163.1 hypothetical protein [Leuconostoc carnosum]
MIIFHKHRFVSLISFFVILNIIEYFVGDWVGEFITKFPLHSSKIEVILNDTFFKVIELILAFILSHILPVPKYFKIIFGRKTVIWLTLMVLITILLAVFNSSNFWEALFIGVVASIPEEYIFRGISLGYLLTIFNKNKKGVVLSLVISAGLFSLYHMGNILSQNLEATILQMVAVFGMGFLFGCLYVRTGSLLIAMFLHFFNNYFVTILNGMDTDYKIIHFSAATVYPPVIQCIILIIIGILVLNIKNPNKWILPKLLNRDVVSIRTEGSFKKTIY